MVELAFRAAVRARGTASRRGAVRVGWRPVGFPPATLLVATLPWAAVTASAALFLEEVFAAAVAVLVAVRSAMTQSHTQRQSWAYLKSSEPSTLNRHHLEASFHLAFGLWDARLGRVDRPRRDATTVVICASRRCGRASLGALV